MAGVVGSLGLLPARLPLEAAKGTFLEDSGGAVTGLRDNRHQTQGLALEPAQRKDRHAVKALLRIRESCRAVLRMRYLEELEYEEIAESLKKTANAIYVRIHNCTKELRRIYVSMSTGE